MRDDPIWLVPAAVEALHAQTLRQFGGLEGLRDAGLLQSALSPARNLFGYGEPDLYDLAAAYAYGVVNNHPFNDGNKRTGFLCAALFLEANGLQFTAPEADAAVMTLALADKSVEEAGYARWLRDNTRPRKVPGSEGPS
jgi:death-on-curing protein